jgi:hypothetical protein
MMDLDSEVKETVKRIEAVEADFPINASANGTK